MSSVSVIPTNVIAVSFNRKNLGVAKDSHCEDCGAPLHLVIDSCGIYDFRCSKLGYTLKDAAIHKLASMGRKYFSEKPR